MERSPVEKRFGLFQNATFLHFTNTNSDPSLLIRIPRLNPNHRRMESNIEISDKIDPCVKEFELITRTIFLPTEIGYMKKKYSDLFPI